MSLISAIDKALEAIDRLLLNQKAAPPAAPACTADGPVQAGPQLTPAAPSTSAPAPPVAESSCQKHKPSAAAAPPPAVSSAPASAAVSSASDELFGKAILKVVRLVNVEPLEGSAKLYKCLVDVGGGATRQICAGLALFVPVERLSGALAVALLNLKAAKLAGQASEGMILAGVYRDADGAEVAVEPLVPPAGCQPGDSITLEGGALDPAAVVAPPPKVLKGDHWRELKTHLAVLGGTATYGGRKLVTALGPILVPEAVKDGSSID